MTAAPLDTGAELPTTGAVDVLDDAVGAPWIHGPVHDAERRAWARSAASAVQVIAAMVTLGTVIAVLLVVGTRLAVERLSETDYPIALDLYSGTTKVATVGSGISTDGVVPNPAGGAPGSGTAPPASPGSDGRTPSGNTQVAGTTDPSSPGWPTPPPPVPVPDAPTAPPVPPPVSPPPTPAPGGGAPQPTSGTRLADRIKIELLFNKDIYASTEFAVGALESERLHRERADWSNLIASMLLRPTVGMLNQAAGPDLAGLAGVTLEADWLSARSWLGKQRPPLALLVQNAPEGTRLAVSLGIPNPAHRSLLAPGQATAVSIVELRHQVGVVTPVAGQQDAWLVFLEPRWDRRALSNLENEIDIDIEVHVAFPDDRSTAPTITHRAQLHPFQDVQLRYPAFCTGFSHFEPSHPCLDDLSARISKDPLCGKLGIRLGASSDWKEAFLWFRAFHQMKITYENSAMAAAERSGDDPIQRIRPIHRVLAEQSGNCVELALLMASALGRSTPVFMALPREHAFVCYHDPSLNMFVGIECTAIGQSQLLKDRRNDPTKRMAPEQLQFRQQLGGADREAFDLFILALWSGTAELAQQCKEAVDGADLGGSRLPNLATLAAERQAAEQAVRQATDQASRQQALQREEQIATQQAWKYMRVIPMQLLSRLGANQGATEPAIRQRYPLPPPARP